MAIIVTLWSVERGMRTMSTMMRAIMTMKMDIIAVAETVEDGVVALMATGVAGRASQTLGIRMSLRVWEATVIWRLTCKK